MIQIKQYNKKYRLCINETWEFEDMNTLQKELEAVLVLKDRFGNLFKKD